MSESADKKAKKLEIMKKMQEKAMEEVLTEKEKEEKRASEEAEAKKKRAKKPEPKKGEKIKKRKIEKKMEEFCRLPFVSEMEDGECGLVSAIATVVTLKKGDVLLRQGEKDSSLYVLIDGRLKVKRDTGGGEQVILAAVQVGDMIGEMGFLDEETHSATLEADTKTDVLRIRRKDLEKLLDKHPQTVYKIMRAIAREVHQITKRMNIQFVEMQNYIQHQHGRY